MTYNLSMNSGPQNHVPFTRISSLLPFVIFLKNLGAPTERFMRKAKIPIAKLDTPSYPIPLHSVYGFLEYAAQSEGIQHFGLTVGQKTSLDDVGVYGYLIQQSHTVYEYLCKGIELIHTETSGEKFWLSDVDGHLRFNIYIPGNSDYGRSQADIYSLIITINTLRKMTNDNWRPTDLHLAAIHDIKLPQLEVLSDTSISTGGNHSSFYLPRSLLSMPFQRPVEPQFSPEAIEQRLSSSLPTEFVSAIRHIVEMLLHQGHSKIDITAEVAGMTVRTLQRRLTESGLSYTQLVKDMRITIAAQWLASEDITITEIAYRLGYADASNFTRAFRQQTGVAPQFYREQIANDQVSQFHLN